MSKITAKQLNAIIAAMDPLERSKIVVNGKPWGTKAAPKKRTGIGPKFDYAARKTRDLPIPDVLNFNIPIQCVSELNQRSTWGAIKRKGIQKAMVHSFLCSHPLFEAKLPKPLHVEFTRVGKRRLDPGAVASSLKYIEDQIFAWIGWDDGDVTIGRDYKQSVEGNYWARVSITFRTKSTT